MLIDLSGRVAIVTGAGRGIGLEIARTLAREGVSVVITDIRQELLDSVGAEWQANGWQGLQLKCDVRSAADNKAIVDVVDKTFGRIDILVNNAGVASGTRVEDMPEDTWDMNFDVNLKGTMLMCQAVIPVMKRQRSGRILNAASFAAIVPSIGGAAYAASKAGVESFTRVLAGELGPWEITANAYAPGMIPTDMNGFANRSPEDQERLLDTLTLRRWGKTSDVASLLCFLASDQANYITGTLIDVSGGKLATQMPWLAHRDAKQG
ncbi:MAG: SDR family oxidoreductase [Alphaproteobacteria bacterium]|nr:SDR family oxidoreductase [Alphaproteobacteria bacterium]